MKLIKSGILSLLIFASPQLVFAISCYGKITEVLSGNDFCSGGERVGFVWSGGSGRLCSANKNMDTLIIEAYINARTVAVRDGTWSSCFDLPNDTVPNHIWFQ